MQSNLDHHQLPSHIIEMEIFHFAIMQMCEQISMSNQILPHSFVISCFFIIDDEGNRCEQ